MRRDIVSTAAFRLPDGTMEPATVNGLTLSEFEREANEYLWVADRKASVSLEDQWSAGMTPQEAARDAFRAGNTMDVVDAWRAEHADEYLGDDYGAYIDETAVETDAAELAADQILEEQEREDFARDGYEANLEAAEVL